MLFNFTGCVPVNCMKREAFYNQKMFRDCAREDMKHPPFSCLEKKKTMDQVALKSEAKKEE
jgi:hypothetical protein